MRSLPNIIKASQAAAGGYRKACLDELVAPPPPPEDEPVAAEDPVEAGMAEREKIIRSAKREMEERKAAEQRDLVQHREAAIRDALEQARNIVESARQYSMSRMREAAARMNEECVRMKISSYEEGYSSGVKQGRKDGEEAGRAEGYREGYQEGCREGEKKGREEILAADRQRQEEIRALLETMEEEKEKTLEKFEAGIENLSFEIAQKVIRREVEREDTAVRTIVSAVLEAYRNQEWVKIRVSPNVAELLVQADSGWIDSMKEVSGNIRIIPCPEMKDGDCRVELPDRLVDAGVDTQMDRIREALELKTQ